MADFKKIENARKILGLGKHSSMDKIKSRYRKLSKKYHPDSCKNEDKQYCEDKFKSINDAYQTILDYIRNYRFSFEKEKVEKTKIDEVFKEHLDRFYDGWWGEL